MVIIELILIVLGVVFMLISFRVTEKLTPKELEYLGSLSKDELKKIIENELNRASVDVDNRLDSIIDTSMEKVEVALDKETNAKIMAISEYSDTVLDNINRNHNEVMFLYSMLNDKHTELTEFASSLRATDFLAQKNTKEKQNLAGQAGSAASGDVMQEVIRAHSALAANSAKGINGIPQEVVQPKTGTVVQNQNVSVPQNSAGTVSSNRPSSGNRSGTGTAMTNQPSSGKQSGTAAQQPAVRTAQPSATVSGNQGSRAAQQGNNIASAQSIRVVPGSQGSTTAARQGRVIASQTGNAAAAAASGNAAVSRTAAMMQELQQKTAVKAPSAVSAAQTVQDTQNMQNGSNHNGQILNLYRDGLSETDIAKQLGLGVGEVKLVIGLFKGES
ncbi:MAG: hypothetical protein HFG80_06220 [Eubacterium sp.]|nr:hypothetical protein [Eubacterium sp.]